MCDIRVKTSAEIHFAQKLACNEKKIRDRSLKRLRRWLALKSSTKHNAFSSQDMMKLWKGLFYCMWMSDKPIIQENLASMISKLIHCFSRKEYSFMFIDCFFQTMSREWFGLDKFRLEKFMMLVRRFLRESFEFLRKHKWMIEDIENLSQVMEKNCLSPQNDATYLSLKLHVIDIFMEELALVDREELTSDKMLNILAPFCNILASTESSVLLFDTSKNVFQPLINQHAQLINERVVSKNKSFNDTENSKNDDVPVFNIDCGELKKLLFDMAKKDNVKKMNRNAMYGLVRKFKDISEGINPLNRKIAEDCENNLFENDDNEAVNHSQESHNDAQKARSKRINDESTGFCNTGLDQKKFKGAKGSGRKPNKKKISA